MTAAGDHANAALALMRRGQIVRAMSALRRALNASPDYAPAHYLLGTCFRALGQPRIAAKWYRRAAALAPAEPEYRIGLARAAALVGDWPLALEQTRVAYANGARDLEVLRDLAEYALRVGDRAAYDRWSAAARSAAPVSHTDFVARGCLRIQAGDFVAGWNDRLHWHAAAADFAVGRSLTGTAASPTWHGEPLAGRPLALLPEGGSGDTMQMFRYLPWATSLGGPVTAVMPRALVRLARTSFAHVPDLTIIEAGSTRRPPAELHTTYLTLPALHRTTLGTIPQPPYLLAPTPRRVLPECRSARVALVWAGDPRHADDATRSMPFAALAPVLTLPEVELFSLQVGDRARDADGSDVARLDSRIADYADTAAWLGQIDCLVTVDTSVAHLAGALGVPTLLCVPFASEWRWMLDRDDTPWYPSMRLIRQPRPGDWRSVAERAAALIAARDLPSRFCAAKQFPSLPTEVVHA